MLLACAKSGKIYHHSVRAKLSLSEKDSLIQPYTAMYNAVLQDGSTSFIMMY